MERGLLGLEGKAPGLGIREVYSDVRAASRPYATGGSPLLDTLASGLDDRSL